MIYENIERLCKSNGVSIARLERECGFGNATVKSWRRCSPTVSKLQTVADYFGIPITDLLSGRRTTDAKRKTGFSGADSAVEQNVPGSEAVVNGTGQNYKGSTCKDVEPVKEMTR